MLWRWSLFASVATLFFTPPPPENVEYFSFRGKTFEAKPCRIYDGDTFTAIFRYKDDWIKWRCRCIGYDAPEMKPSLTMPDREIEKTNAVRARDRLIELITRTDSIYIQCGDFDKYGRILVVIHSKGFEKEERSINELMLEEDYIRPLTRY